MLKKLFIYSATKCHNLRQVNFFQSFFVRLAFLLNKLGNYQKKWSRDILHFLNPNCYDENTDFYNRQFISLTKEIQSFIKEQQKNYKHYSYFYGYPYQGFAMLGIFGERPTEERYEEYLIEKFVKETDRILDLGCSCGFLSVYTSFKKGSVVDGIDINPYSIKIGQACARFLKISNKVNLLTKKIQDFQASCEYDAVFSFATHWTDDANYRVPLEKHLKKLVCFIRRGGYIFFESHCADLNRADFLEEIKKFSENMVSIEFQTLTDCNRRHFYIFKKR